MEKVKNKNSNLLPAKIITKIYILPIQTKFYIAKRIDRFLVDAMLMHRLKILKSWSFYSEISDHEAIMLEWKEGLVEVKIPFKFSMRWVNEPALAKTIFQSWLLVH